MGKYTAKITFDEDYQEKRNKTTKKQAHNAGMSI